jgi:carbonic anhydrase/acetyltransferase-like protein (isoleucine patch superfamily)
MVPSGLGFGGERKSQAFATITSGTGQALRSALLPILGNDVLQTWTERIRKVGVQDIWLTSSGKEAPPALGQFVKQGIERLLMIKLKSYAEMDLDDLVRFHCQSGSPVTEVSDSRGRLGISVFDQLAFSGDEKFSADDKKSGNLINRNCTQYPFGGYAKRILSPRERQELIGDALTGACEMRPAGEQIAERVWVGKDVSLAQSAKIIGPSYIGDRAIVAAGATIGPFTSVERDCIVDCGTMVERSTVLPSTYLGAGLLIRRALVDGGQLEDLEDGTVADLQPAGLAHRVTPRKLRRQAFNNDTPIFSPDCNAWIGTQFVPEFQQVRP